MQLSVFTAAIEFLKCCYVVARVCSLLFKKKKKMSQASSLLLCSAALFQSVDFLEYQC